MTDAAQWTSVANALGRRVFVDPRDERGLRLLESGADANPHSMTMWRDLLASQTWDIVVDVGANYGEMTLGAATPQESTVVAFEPSERVLPYLRRSLDAAGVPVDVRALAVSDRGGDATLLLDSQWSGMSHLSGVQASDSTHPVTEQTCRTTTLDAEFAGGGFRTACIKIDIEGHEAAALAGATRWFEELDDCAVMIEVLHMDTQTLVDLSRSWRLYLRHLRTGRSVRIDGLDPQSLEALKVSGSFYLQDAILRKSAPGDDGAAEERQSLLDVLTALDTEIDREREAVVATTARLEQVLASRSWRLTGPVRKLLGGAG